MASQRTLDLVHLTAALNGDPTFLGVIIATTTAKNNATTTTPFNATGDGLAGKTLMIQPDVACYVITGATSAGTVAVGTATGNGILLAAGERCLLTMKSTNGFLSAVTASGTVNLKVWELV